MRRAKQLGSVIFDMNTLFIREELANAKIMGTSVKSAAGTDIVWGAIDHAQSITLDSKQYGWVDDAKKDAIEAMWEDFTTHQTLTYDDDSTVTVRMAIEKHLVFTPLYEGSRTYTAVIPLAKA